MIAAKEISGVGATNLKKITTAPHLFSFDATTVVPHRFVAKERLGAPTPPHRSLIKKGRPKKAASPHQGANIPETDPARVRANPGVNTTSAQGGQFPNDRQPFTPSKDTVKARL